MSTFEVAVLLATLFTATTTGPSRLRRNQHPLRCTPERITELLTFHHHTVRSCACIVRVIAVTTLAHLANAQRSSIQMRPNVCTPDRFRAPRDT